MVEKIIIRQTAFEVKIAGWNELELLKLLDQRGKCDVQYAE